MPVPAAAFCPHPPLLVPELAGAAAPELAGLRGACDQAVAAIAAYGLPVLVLGVAAEGAEPRTYGSAAAGTLAPWGAAGSAGGTGPAELPLSLTIGAWLLDRAMVPLESRTYLSVTSTRSRATDPADPSTATSDQVLLVMGDGSATRTAKAPGGFDPAAEAFDARVAGALSSGDPAALAAAAADPAGHALGAAGQPAWSEAARLVGARPPAQARLLADEAPYGVGYLVAVWTWEP